LLSNTPLAYNSLMRFIETGIFTERVTDLLDDEEYRALQLALIFRPEQGPIVRGSGGLRKIRWVSRGRGKRGGTRIIYYWDEEEETFYLLLVYSKTRQEDLTPQQVRELGRLVREEFK
jgi:mRNA-degrading endonuclease RelE of RelBE toxin-antitoxin system